MLDKYFNNIENNNMYAIVTVLDPRCLLRFQTNESADEAKALRLEHVSSFSDIASASSNSDNTASIATTMNDTLLWSSFDSFTSKFN